MIDASHLLAGMVVFGVILVILAVLKPEVALALISAIERLVVAFLKPTKALAQKVKRKTD